MGVLTDSEPPCSQQRERFPQRFRLCKRSSFTKRLRYYYIERSRLGLHSKCDNREQLYEIKLLSLLYFRAIHDDTIQEFQLATNVNIGAFGDICFNANLQGKLVCVFIQVKHWEIEKNELKNDLTQYFDSYKKIKQHFDPCNEDLFFRGSFEERECLFVIYTAAKDDCGNKWAKGDFHSTLHDLIDTGGTVKHSNNQEEDVVLLCNLVIKDQITSLAGRIASFMFDEQNFQTMLSDEFVLQYHVILAREVVDVSDIQLPESKDAPHYRIASFRHDFFENKKVSDACMLFRNALYLEVIKRKMKRSTKAFSPNINVSLSTDNKAAAIKILLTLKFKVPIAFGNKDLTLRGSDTQIEKRICYLALKIKDLLDKCESSKIVTIDASLEDGFFLLNGIADAIGNIFVLDDDTKLMKITDNFETLGIFAQRLYKKLSDEINNLDEYNFFFNIDKFPKLLFDSNEHEKNLARDFLNKLLFYCEQAEENVVEEILKNEIKEYQRNHPNYFQVKTDAILLEYYNEILNWCKEPERAILLEDFDEILNGCKEPERDILLEHYYEILNECKEPEPASYLTRENNLFQKAINNIIEDQQKSLIHLTHIIKIKNNDYRFTEDAVRSLNLHDHSSTVIITESNELTVVKVLQHLKDKEHVVLDLTYVLGLPTKSCNALLTVLTNTSNNNYLIFDFNETRITRNKKKTLENIAEAIHEIKTIIITNNTSLTLVNEYFPKVDNIVHDENISLIHMSEESQKIILEKGRVKFQGVEVRLGLIVDEKAKVFVKGNILNTITRDCTIAVGKLSGREAYDKIKHLYIDRRIKNKGDGVSIMVESLYDLSENVILITADPGMGKSTLLTHLSLKTKMLQPGVWIVRINLLEYSKEISKWKQDNTVIDTLETLKFLCQVILREQHDGTFSERNEDFELDEDNSVVYLKQCTGGQRTTFVLKLFLHFYQEGKLIFLFDGFDEISPHYTNEVLTCLKTVRDARKHTVWVTSRSYRKVKTILQREFGSSYDIENFSYTEMQKYLETFWEYNLRLEELSSAQEENVKSFIEYMLASENLGLRNFAMPLRQVCVNAAYYLINEIKNKHIALWTDDKKFDDSYFIKEKDNYIFKFHDNSHGNPLHLYLAAVFFEENIKTVDNKTNKWNLEYNTFSFYERFMEKKMTTIWYFTLKYQRLAAYAIFELQSPLFFSVRHVEEIEETISFIRRKREESGLIYRVVNGIPIFIHMTFTEYFAVEYVCDCLKNENDSERMRSWMNFVFNVMFSMENLMYIRKFLDYRIKNDEILMRILESNKEVIFNLIMEQGWIYSNSRSTPSAEGNYWALSDALQQELHNLKSFFIGILECYLNESNLNDFLNIVEGSRLLLIARKQKSDVIIKFVIDVVRKIDKSKLTSVLRDNFSFLSDSMISRYAELSSQNIVELLVEEDYYCIEPFDSD